MHLIIVKFGMQIVSLELDNEFEVVLSIFGKISLIPYQFLSQAQVIKLLCFLALVMFGFTELIRVHSITSQERWSDTDLFIQDDVYL